MPSVGWQIGTAHGLRQQLALAGEASVVEASTASDAIDQRRAGQRVGNQRGGSGVADAHFADADDVAALVGERASDFGTGVQRRLALRRRHGRLDQIVACPGRRDLGVDQSAARSEFMRHAAVDHLQRQPVLAREDVGTCVAGQIVLDHLPGHVLRIGGDAGGRRAVVGGEDEHVRIGKLRLQRLLDTSDAQRDVLQ